MQRNKPSHGGVGSSTVHIFYVQSFLSYFVCRQIVNHLGLQPQQVHFIIGRDFGLDLRTLPYPLTYIGSAWRKADEFVGWSRHKAALFTSTFDQLINQISGGALFSLYVNRMNYRFVTLAHSRDDCKQVNVYEEGSAAHRFAIGATSSTRTVATSLKEAYLYGRRSKTFNAIYDQRYSTAFKVTAGAFPGFPRVVALDLPQILDAEYAQKARMLPKGSIIIGWHFQSRSSKGSAENQLRPAECLISISQKLIRLGYDHIYVRPHPDSVFDEEMLRKAAASLQTCHPHVAILQQDLRLPTEAIMYQRQDVHYCVGFSSIGILAQAYGRPCYLARELLMGPESSQRCRTMVQDFGSIDLDAAVHSATTSLP